MWYRRGFGEALETMRTAWGEAYDFVLVDSRTGITDAGGICTVQMPDVLVLLTTASEQGLEGTFDVAHRALAARKKLAFDRAALQLLPVLARFDQRVEICDRVDVLEALRRAHGAASANRGCPTRSRRSRSRSSRRFLTCRICRSARSSPCSKRAPKIPRAWATRSRRSPLSSRVDSSDADLLARNRDAYVASAQSASAAQRASEGHFAFDVFLVARGDGSLAKLLEKEGLRVFVDARDKVSAETRESNLRGARALVIVREGPLSGAEVEDAASFLKTADSSTQRLVVVGAGRAPHPTSRRSDLSTATQAAIAERIAVAVRTTPRDGDPHHGAFGGASTRRGRSLTATFADAFHVTLRVRATPRGAPLAGTVRFHLHPMLPSPIRDVPVRDGAAELELALPVPFTVGAETDDGKTPLELYVVKEKSS